MPKPKEPYDLQKVTLNLRVGDWTWLRIMHGRKGAGKVIRDMVIKHIARVEAAAKEKP